MMKKNLALSSSDSSIKSAMLQLQQSEDQSNDAK